MRMKAAVAHGVNQRIVIEEVEIGDPRQGELLVKIVASGLCASDMNALDGKRNLVPFPAILGHEAAGIVVSTGPGVTDFKDGDHVIISIVPSCGACTYCTMGKPNFCLTAGSAMAAGGLFDKESVLTLNSERLNHFLCVSSFAEYVVVPASGAVRIPKEMPLDRAALISCAVLTGYGAVVNTAKVTAGSRVAVFGCGGVGLNIIQGARMAGAKEIVAIDISPEKLDLAKKVGATHGINFQNEDPVAAVRAYMSGGDFVFDATGREETVNQAWLTVDAFGSLTLVGLMRSGTQLSLSADPFVNEQLIQGCYFGSSHLSTDVPLLVTKYLTGELLLDEVISDRIKLDQINEAFDQLKAGEGARSVLVFD